MTLKLALSRSRPSVPYGANFLLLHLVCIFIYLPNYLHFHDEIQVFIRMIGVLCVAPYCTHEVCFCDYDGRMRMHRNATFVLLHPDTLASLSKKSCMRLTQLVANSDHFYTTQSSGFVPPLHPPLVAIVTSVFTGFLCDSDMLISRNFDPLSSINYSYTLFLTKSQKESKSS